jgi:hypothetical protein
MIRYYELKRVVKADEEELKNHCDYRSRRRPLEL